MKKVFMFIAVAMLLGCNMQNWSKEERVENCIHRMMRACSYHCEEKIIIDTCKLLWIPAKEETATIVEMEAIIVSSAQATGWIITPYPGE